MTNVTSTAKGGINWLDLTLWGAAILLALFYGMAGFMKVSQPISALSANGMSFVGLWPEWAVRLIGIAELAGAIGVILPAMTRIMPQLVPLAALGFSVIQVLAIIYHATQGETAMTLPINLVALAVSLFLVWGRAKALPINPR